jgi:hypothetical protein
MTLGERCDEIVRLIEETLSDVESSTPATLLSSRRRDQELRESLAKTA